MKKLLKLFAGGPHKNPLVVFDLDGTLYNQRQLRIHMALQMIKELLCSSCGRRKIKIIDSFRKVREKLAENEAEDVINLQYAIVASELSISEDEVRAVTDEWLLRRPLPILKKCREPYIDHMFLQLRKAGKIVAILSDYPAHAKLDALDLHADIVVASTDLEVNRFKPNPKGLLMVLNLANILAEQCVVIGDRMDRDGECARRVGAHFLLKRKSRFSMLSGVSSYKDLLVE
jgi:FMN phosphatase YigB (HAD superfamily)